MSAMVERLSTLGAGLRVDGHLVGDGSIEIRGHFEGSIHIGGELHVAQGAVVRADVLASRVLVLGTLVGSVRATREVRVGSTGELQGKVEGHLLVDDGGVYRGHMTPGPARPQKTVNTLRRPVPPLKPVVEEADQKTEDALPSIEAAGPVATGRSLHGAVGRSHPTEPQEDWFGEIAARQSELPPYEITEGEPPPRSVSRIPALTAEQVALRLGAPDLPAPKTGDVPPPYEDPLAPATAGPDPTELPTGPTRLAIPNPPRRRTTAPGVAPFRQAFGAELRAVAAVAPTRPPGPRPASVSGHAVPVVTGPAPLPGAVIPPAPAPTPEADADLSDSWFLPDDGEL